MHTDDVGDDSIEDPDGSTESSKPLIDVSKALHEAGHEVEYLGFEGVPDTAPLIHQDPEGVDPKRQIEGEIATRGADPG